jgi:general secretion pathway protein D
MITMPKSPLNLSQTALGALAVASLLLGSGCSLYKAKKAFDAGRYEESAQAYHQIVDKDPKNLEARIGYKRAALRASEEHLELARQAQNRGQGEVMEREVRKAYRLDPSNSRAQEWIARIEIAARKKQAEEDAQDSLEEQKERAENRSAILLNPRSIESMDLNFSRKTSLKDIFAALSKNSGISIILHTSFQDTQITADLRGLSFQRILDTLMLQSDLFYKVIDTNTIMVFKSSNQAKTDYENQLIQTFYLSNADINDVRQVFQTLLPLVRVVPDKRMNALTVKARPVDMTIARRIVNQLDKAKAEVMVYLELLEVTENNMEQVGLMPVLSASDGMGGGSGMYRLGASLAMDGPGGTNQSKGSLSFKKSPALPWMPCKPMVTPNSWPAPMCGSCPVKSLRLRSARKSAPPSLPSPI